MTETMTEDTQSEQTEQTEQTEESKPLPTLEEAFGASAVAAKDLIAQANEKIAAQNKQVAWLRDNSRDPQEIVDALRNGEKDDDELKPMLEKAERLKSQFESLDAKILIAAEKKAAAIVAEDTDTEAVESHTKDYETAVKNVREIRTALKTIFGEEVFNYLDGAQTLKRKSAGSPGSGPPRLRGFTVKVDDTVAQKKMGPKQELKSSWGAAAERIGDTSVKSLVEAYQKVVGTTDAEKYPTGKWTEFEYTVGDKTYKIEAMKEA